MSKEKTVILTPEDVEALKTYLQDSVDPESFSEAWNHFKATWYNPAQIAKMDAAFKKLGVLE